MKATELDKRFDAGEDESDQIDWSRSKRPNTELKRVNIDLCGQKPRSTRLEAGGDAAIADADQLG